MGFVLPQLALPGEPASGSNSTSSASVQGTSTGSAAVSSPKASSSSKPATGAAVSGRWRGGRAEAVIGAAVLLGVAGLW